MAKIKFFNPKNFNPWNEKDKLKIVTHHWGTNKNKGFEVYEYIDQLISVEPWKDKIEFTFIGNLPKNYKFYNSTSRCCCLYKFTVSCIVGKNVLL